MIIVKINGGLGNQLFCYSYAKSLEKMGYDVKIDTSTYKSYHLHGGFHLNEYKIDLEISSKSENLFYLKNPIKQKFFKVLGIKNKNIIEEKTLGFDKNLLNIPDNKFIIGYFQSEKYFKNIREILLNQFHCNFKISSYSSDIKKIILNTQNSCSIHVRRGDYISEKNKKIYHQCSIDYYKDAINILEKKYGEINFFVFSDEIKWVKKNLKLKNALYIENDGSKKPNEDILLMSKCKFNIIANSSFSWWGAWLNQFEGKHVISPKKWFINKNLNKYTDDILCNDWEKI